MDITVTFKGFKTLEQAEAFANWYSGSGEQQASEWMEIWAKVTSCNTEKITIHPGHIFPGRVEVDLKIN